MTSVGKAASNRTTYIPHSNNTVSTWEAINLMLTILMWSLVPLGLLGLVTNTINVLVYLKIGLRDSASICFFALSTCDLCFTIISIVSNTFNIIMLVKPDMLYINHHLTSSRFYEGMLFDISALIKTFIAVQRGCCVAFPFHVNRVFTKKKTTAVIVCLTLLYLACYVNWEFLKSKEEIRNTYINRTEAYTMFTDGSRASDTFRTILNKTVVICCCEILVLLSLFAIIYGMKSTTKRRQTLKAGQNLKNKKDTSVIKQVTLVSVVHLICCSLVSARAILVQFLLNFKISFQFVYVYLALNEIINFTGPCGATMNFFIYYHYNHRFKQTVSGICRKVHLKH